MTDYEPPTVGEVLRRTLDAQAVSQVDLAEHTGLTPKHVNQVLSDTVNLSPDVAVRFARALGIPAQVWLGVDGARRDWEAGRHGPDASGLVVGKIRRQRDEALARASRAEREIERLQGARTDQGLRDRLAAVRAVADEWRQFALGHPVTAETETAWQAMVHALCCVLAAVDGADGDGAT